MTIDTVADLTATGPILAASAGNIGCRWLSLTASAAGARFGDVANVASGRGVALAAGVTTTFYASAADPTDQIMLDQAAVYIASGNVSVAYGN